MIVSETEVTSETRWPDSQPTMAPRWLLYYMVTLAILDAALALLELELEPDDRDTLVEIKRDRRFLSSPVRRIFGSHPPCGPPDSCPPHHCRLDDAVLHGYCCGCALPSDRVPLTCPPWLRCPPSPYPLCDDYNWMMDCCC